MLPIMEQQNETKPKKSKKMTCDSAGGCSGCAYILGFLGAFIYYVQHAESFLVGLWGFVKALVWPAVLVYKIMEFLVM